MPIAPILRLQGGQGAANRAASPADTAPLQVLSAPVSGRSSGVEHNLAKVGVEGSNPFARSIFFLKNEHINLIAKVGNLLPRPVRRSGEAGGKQKSAFRGVEWRAHCGILNRANPRRKGHRNSGKDRPDCFAKAKSCTAFSLPVEPSPDCADRV